MEEEEKEYTEEELRELIHKMLENIPEDEEPESDVENDIINMLTKRFSIEEAIAMKKENDKYIKSSFDNCNKLFKFVSLNRDNLIKILRYAKVRLNIVKYMSIILNLEYTESIVDNLEKVRSTDSKVKNEKELLNSIKNSINTLQKNNVVLCNNDICLLLAYINNLNGALLSDVEEYLKINSMAIRGIRYNGNKTYEEDIKAIEERIDEFKLTLGLPK